MSNARKNNEIVYSPRYTQSYVSAREMQQYNSYQRTLREYRGNMNEGCLKREIRYLRMELENLRPTPFALGLISEISYNELNLPQNILECVEALASGTTFDPVGLLLLILPSVALATQGRVFITLTEKWREPTPLMTIQSALSGMRKSGTLEFLRFPFKSFEESKNLNLADQRKEQEFAKKIKSSADSAVRLAMKDVFKQNGFSSSSVQAAKMILGKYQEAFETYDLDIQKAVRLLLDSSTPTALCKTLKYQGCIGSITAEATMIEKLLFSQSADQAFFNFLHTQEAYEKTITHEDVTLKAPALYMINFVQPAIHNKIYRNEGLQKIGVSARFLPFFYAQYLNSEKSIKNGKEEYEKVIHRLLARYFYVGENRNFFECKLSPRALSMVLEFEEKIVNHMSDFPVDSHPALRKLHGHAVRLAWAIHAWNFSENVPHEHEITDAEMSTAIQLCIEVSRHISFAYDPAGLQAVENAQKIINDMYKINNFLSSDTVKEGYISSNILRARTQLKQNDLFYALNLLEKNNFIRVIDNGSAEKNIVFNPRI